MAKYFYDNVKKVEQVQFSPFTELLTEGFDNDQIWEEIASQNEPFLDYAKSTIKQFNKRPVKTQQYNMDIDAQEMDQDVEEPSEEEEEVEDQNLQLEGDDDEEEEEEEEQSEVEDMDAEEEEEEDAPASKKKQASEVDDQFFNLEEFNKWTDKQEELTCYGEEDSEEEEGEDAAEMSYNDFFGEEVKGGAKKPYKPKKKVEYEEELVDSMDEDEEEEEEEDDNRSEGSVRDLFGADESEEEGDAEEKSAFQNNKTVLLHKLKNSKMKIFKKSIGHYVVKLLPRPDPRRFEFEHANKPVPIITQESTNTLEDMIKKRILDNMFDDVVRKVDPTLRPFIPSKRVEISDEKAKQSLADMYEDDFVRKNTGTEKVDARDEALEKDHEEISELFKTLCHKLDALSNFHYTPKAAKPEMSIVSNSAAISMEEVTPVNVSDATLLAPEEVYDKKRNDVKTAAEMDQDERKRMRAQKKKLKRKERDMKERELKVIQKYNPQAGQRQAKTKAVKELLGQKNVTVIGKDGQKKSTSKAVTSASLF
ncbi:unnamed protein product [Mucor hiemalis]